MGWGGSLVGGRGGRLGGSGRLRGGCWFWSWCLWEWWWRVVGLVVVEEKDGWGWKVRSLVGSWSRRWLGSLEGHLWVGR